LHGIRRFVFAGAALVLVASVLLLGSAVGQAALDERLRRSFCLVLFGALGAVVIFLRAKTVESSALDRVIAAAAIILPCYALLQIVPLPFAIVTALSPLRAEVLRALAALTPLAGGPPSFASLSIVPGITFTHFVLITGYAVVFFSIRELVRFAPRSGWFFAVPVLVAAVLECLAGLIQAAAGVVPHGTYAIKNHFAGLLTMALPFAVAWLLFAVHGAKRGGLDTAVGVQLSGAAVLASLLVVGIVLSLSRGGFVSALVSMVVIAVVAFPSGMSGRGRLLACGAACLALFSGLFYLTPMALVQRLAEHTSSGRIAIWRNTLDLIRAYPLVGCGLGGYESAMLRFKTTVLMNDLDYAHNDYLQFLGELGAIGFLIGAVLFGALLVRTVKATAPGSPNRWVAVGCAGALAAILTHTMLDFNLYVPANALTLAWIAGISAGLSSRMRDEDGVSTEVLSTVSSQSRRSR
jgi:O-antigen ligase